MVKKPSPIAFLTPPPPNKQLVRRERVLWADPPLTAAELGKSTNGQPWPQSHFLSFRTPQFLPAPQGALYTDVQANTPKLWAHLSQTVALATPGSYKCAYQGQGLMVWSTFGRMGSERASAGPGRRVRTFHQVILGSWILGERSRRGQAWPKERPSKA